MKPRFLASLSNRVLFSTVTIVVTLATVLVGYFTLHNRKTLENYQQSSGIALAESISEAARLGVISSEPLFLEQPFRIAMNDPHVLFIAAYDSAGSLISQSSRGTERLELTNAQLSALPSIAAPANDGRLPVGGADADIFISPVTSEETADSTAEEMLVMEGEEGEAGATVNVGYIRIGLSRERLDAAERSALFVSVVMGIAAVALAITVAVIIGRRITRPLKALEEGARRISGGNLEAEVRVAGEDELGAVAKAFNKMTSALRETTVSKEFMDGIIGSMNEAMMVVGIDRTVASVNGATERLLGFAEGELVGLPSDALFYDPENHPLDRSRWELVKSGPRSRAEAELRTKDGQKVPVDISVAPMADKAGEIHGVVCVARDMREIRGLLEKLKSHASELEDYQSVLFSMLDDNEKSREETESERAKMTAAVESMTDGLIMFDPSGRIIIMNPSARGMFDMDLSQEPDPAHVRSMLGEDLDALIAGGHADDSSVLAHEITMGHAGDRTIRVEGVSVGQPGQRLGAMLVMRDITKQRELDQAKYELISNVSHELRTPLAIISNVISNALVGVAGELSDRLRKNLETCRANTKRLAHIIDSMVNIASIDRGKSAISREKVDIREIVREVALQRSEEAKAKGLEMSANLPESPLDLFVDRNAIRSMLSNLIENAIRYTEKGCVKVSACMRGTNAEISVADTGVGISKEDQKSIFEYFYQVGRVYGPGEKGVGLGLPLAQKIAKMHGGSISVSSSAENGTVFTVTLPVAGSDDTTISE